MHETKLFVAVKACIVNRQREILLLRESSAYKDGTNEAKYDVPGGRIDTSEKLSEALGREVFEETGLRIDNYELLDVHDTFNEKNGEVWHIVRLYYKVFSEEKNVILSQDHDDYMWVRLDKVNEHSGVIKNLLPIFRKITN